MSEKVRLSALIRPWTPHLIALLIFCLTLFVYWNAPPSIQVTDSGFSMLASQSLIEYGTLALDNYAVDRSEPKYIDDHVWNGEHYNLEYVRGRIYHFFPPGNIVLSVPFVAVMNRLGISAVNADGTYNHKGETIIETTIAVILMASLAVIWFYTSLLLLPLRWSILLTFAGAFGTQAWSTATRALWSHTWETLLFGGVVYLLVAQETRKHALSPVLLATLLAWSYFVRPTSSIVILAVSFYILLYYRRLLPRYLITGAIWLALFIIYSWHNFGTLLPTYYNAQRLNFSQFWTALAGNLISPARGTIIYVPVLLFIAYLLARYRRYVWGMRLVWLALSVIVGHLMAISGFMYWWGGHSYGARYTTELVPWFFLLGVIAVKAMLEAGSAQAAKPRGWARRIELLAGSLLLCLSVFIQARGVYAFETWRWNLWIPDPKINQDEFWNWRYPQFLVGLIEPPAPRQFPPPVERIDFASAQADPHLWFGWSLPGEPFRWSESGKAGIVFTSDRGEDLWLRMKVMPFRAPGKVERQQVIVQLNDKQVGQLVITEVGVYSVMLPKEALREHNRLVFVLPNAASPYSCGTGDDIRPLAIGVYWMEFARGGADRTASARPVPVDCPFHQETICAIVSEQSHPRFERLMNSAFCSSV